MDKSLMYGGDLPLVYPATEERAAYNEVVQMYADAFRGTGNRIAILKSELRSEVLLGDGVNTIEWNLRADQPNPGQTIILPTENRLDINDAFVAREVSVQFGYVPLIGDAPDYCKTLLIPFNNELLFGGVVDGVTTAYNGKLSMEVNTTKFMDGLGMSAFLYAQEAQAGLAVSTDPLGNRYVQNTYDQKGPFVTMVPQFRVKGADKTSFQLRLPCSADFVPTDPEEQFRITAVLIIRGLRVQNGGTYRSGN